MDEKKLEQEYDEGFDDGFVYGVEYIKDELIEKLETEVDVPKTLVDDIKEVLETIE